MANQEQLEILKQGVEVWNKWRDENSDIAIDLREANLAETNLWGADLKEANLSQANLLKAKLSFTKLSGANLNGANLNFANLMRADLNNALLSRASLMEAYLWAADFRNADLNKADLRQAELSKADVRRANLAKADLRHANLSQGDFREANFTGALLVGANLSGAKLTEAQFHETRLGETVLVNIDLSNTYGLANAVHNFPSSIGMDTIHLSKGTLPIRFLQGCGLSDLDIEYSKLANPDLDPEQATDITYKIHQLYIGSGIHYYSCFISYSSKDHEFAQRLHDDLQNNGVRCWFDREDIKIGEKIRPTIDRQIRLRDKLLVILSENSINSEYVGDEVEAALEEENKSRRLVLFPIRLDDTVMDTRDDWAAKIKRRRHIGDFSDWKNKNSYQKAFETLLRDLKATE